MKERDVIIEVKGVSKKFCKNLKRSLVYGFKDILKLGSGSTDDLRKDEFWAVSDVSFTLKRGDCLGLIGHNGAGKSTLLKILNGLISPDKGEIRIHGRVGALIELGAGFNPILTGRENIYNNGAVLGFSKKEVGEKIKEIIDFSEIEEFIDMPVQNYSSGMKVRLGFAVAAHMEPDLLLIDEVLAVGDVGFRIKCFNTIAELMQKAAVVLVSHAMPQIARIASSVLLLERGNVNFAGKTFQGIEAYYGLFPGETKMKSGEGADFSEFSILNDSKTVVYGKDLKLNFSMTTQVEHQNLVVNLIFFDKELKAVASCSSGFFPSKRGVPVNVSMQVPQISFSPGFYSIGAMVIDNDSTGRRIGQLVQYKGLAEFQVVGRTFLTHAAFQLIGNWSADGQEIVDDFLVQDELEKRISNR